ncbi:hypothetical protein [Nioella sp. MMSF_3534]|uniref:hypothetical protein n=1 Tax=Nioella sp. MMSF_3534 TaxID=3046720 RepID=UPI0027401C43|nr:hypothetical protein [Nioella sp. MMSF_3534]
MYRYLVICVGLAACVTAGGEFASPVTGITGTYSHQVVISDHPHHVLYGHVVVLTGDDAAPVRALVISHRRDGVHRLRISGAYHSGRELPFRRLDHRLGCTHGHCRNDALGFIALGPGMIERATREGFSAHLLGPYGRIGIHAPAALFRYMTTRSQQPDTP